MIATTEQIKIHNVEQGTQEWLRLRLGRIGGTGCYPLLEGQYIDHDRNCCPECNSISVTYRKRTEDWKCNGCKSAEIIPIRYGDSERARTLSDGAKTLIYALVGERITGPIDTYVSPAMQRGTDLEPLARKRYEREHFCQVEQIGYISKGNFLGVSPDGKIKGEKAGIEIKCPGAVEYLKFLDTKEVDNKYFAQCQWLMYVTGWTWVDFIMYHPDFVQDIATKRIEPDPDTFATWDKKIPHVIEEMQRLMSLVENNY